MTVSSGISSVSYSGNGATTGFSYTFKIFDDSDLEVYLKDNTTGVSTLQTLTTDYTVSGAGNSSGGTVTFATAPASGKTVIIRRELPFTQETDYVENDPFPAQAHEDALDKLTMLTQQNDRGVDRSIRKPVGDAVSISMELPEAATRADRVLVFDSTGAVSTAVLAGNTSSTISRQQFTGNGSTTVFTLTSDVGTGAGVVIYIDGVYQEEGTYTVTGTTLTFTEAPPTNASIEVVSYKVSDIAISDASAVSYVPAGTGAVQTTVQTKLRESVSVKDFGAVSDGVTDNTSVVQTALNAANGQVVHIPDNTLFDLSALTFPNDNFSSGKGRYALSYLANDDTSSPSQPNANNTHERIFFQQNNNPAGYNNESQFLSGYSTGVVLDVRRDINSPNIGPGQIVEYGRTSVVWRQDGLNRFQLKYTDSAGDTSSPGLDDGMTAQYWEPRVTLGNIKQSSFTATLATGDMVKGSSSGARGWVRQISGSSIIVTVLSGAFTAGETVILEPATETTTDTISTVSNVAYTSRSNRIGFSSKNSGNMFSNIQGDDAVYPVTIGGILGIQQSNTTNGSFTNAEIILADDFGNTTQQARIQLEASTGDIVFLNETTNLEVLRLSNVGAALLETDYVRATTELQSTGASGTIRLGAAGSNPVIKKGSGTPEGVVSAGVGSLFVNTSGGAGTTLYVKEGGAGNTGWVAK